MPIPAANGLNATLGTSIQGTITWTLELRYADFCTNFVHDGSSQNFTGNARLAGDAVVVASSSTSYLGPAPSLVMSVATALYTISGGTTHPYFFLEGLNIAQPYSSFTPNYATLDATFAAQSISFVGSNSIQGLIYGNIRSGGSDLASYNVVINMGRGGSCPV